jgi:hypothetical protein
MPYPSQVKKAGETPAEVHVILMRVGVNVKSEPEVGGTYQKKGKGQAKGLIEYTDVTSEHPDLVKEFQDWFAERAVVFAKTNGYIK